MADLSLLRRRLRHRPIHLPGAPVGTRPRRLRSRCSLVFAECAPAWVLLAARGEPASTPARHRAEQGVHRLLRQPAAEAWRSAQPQPLSDGVFRRTCHRRLGSRLFPVGRDGRYYAERIARRAGSARASSFSYPCKLQARSLFASYSSPQNAPPWYFSAIGFFGWPASAES